MQAGRRTSGARFATKCVQSEYTAQANAADLEVEKLTEQAALAQYYFEIRGQDMLQQILNETVEADKKALDATQGSYDAGVGDYISVVEAKTVLCSRRSLQPLTWASCARNIEHAIAMLVGKLATDFSIPVKPMTLYATGNSCRCAVAAGRAQARHGGGRAHTCRSERHHRHWLRRVLPANHHQRQRGFR